MPVLALLFALTATALTPAASVAQPSTCVVTGTLETVSRDETDGARFIGLLKDSTTRQTMFLAFPGKAFSPQFLQGLTGDKVEVSGTRNPGETIKRPYLDFFIGLARTNDVRVLRHVERKKSRIAPSLDDPPLSHLTIPRSGRRAAEGYVLATWGRSRFLLRTENGETILVYHPAPSLPDAGDFVRCEGFPETDLFRLAIVCKTWNTTAPTFPPPHDPVVDLPPRRLFVGEDGGVCPCSVEKTKTVGKTDIMVASLNAELTPNIKPAKILPEDYEKYIGDGKGLPIVTFNQREQAFLSECRGITSNGVSNAAATNAQWKALGGKIVVGDSGNPAFLLVGNEPILLYCLHTGGVGHGPSVFRYRKEIQKAMDELCPGYKLEEFDFDALGLPSKDSLGSATNECRVAQGEGVGLR